MNYTLTFTFTREDETMRNRYDYEVAAMGRSDGDGGEVARAFAERWQRTTRKPATSPDPAFAARMERESRARQAERAQREKDSREVAALIAEAERHIQAIERKIEAATSPAGVLMRARVL
jgi:hypothetical protein